nr:MAG TPA: hypothetical protein [Caudoviricetes sp.]
MKGLIKSLCHAYIIYQQIYDYNILCKKKDTLWVRINKILPDKNLMTIKKHLTRSQELIKIFTYSISQKRRKY